MADATDASDNSHIKEVETAIGQLDFRIENNLSLVVLMGLPGSGKTTLANKISHSFKKWRTIIFAFDELVPLHVQAKLFQSCSNADASSDRIKEASTGVAKVIRKKFVHCIEAIVKFTKEFRSDKEYKTIEDGLQFLRSLLCTYESNDFLSDQLFLSKVEFAVKAIRSFFAEDPKCKFVILVDDNNYYHSMRNDFYQVAKQFEIGFSLIHCQSTLKTCSRRNLERPVELQVPHKAIVEMSLKFEDPDPLQNACDVYCVQIDMNMNQADLNIQLLEEIVSNSISHPLEKTPDRTEEIEKERRICSENEVHQADLVLRKWINKQLNITAFSNSFKMQNENTVGSNVGNSKKNLSKELNARKKMMLEKLKCGEMKVSFQIDQDLEFQGEIIKLFENCNLK